MALSTRTTVTLSAAALLLAGLLVGLPWWLYAQGLAAYDRLPQPPAQLASAAEQQQVWQRAGAAAEPEAVVLNPVTYLLSASFQARPPEITAYAWRVASAHGRTHLLQAQGPTSRHLAGAALTIWLTRHWRVEQLLSRIAELERGGAGPSDAPA
jgi:hypothetical protein